MTARHLVPDIHNQSTLQVLHLLHAVHPSLQFSGEAACLLCAVPHSSLHKALQVPHALQRIQDDGRRWLEGNGSGWERWIGKKRSEGGEITLVCETALWAAARAWPNHLRADLGTSVRMRAFNTDHTPLRKPPPFNTPQGEN